NREEGTDANHPDDVRRGGLEKAHPAIERHHRGEKSAISRPAVPSSGTSGFRARASALAAIDGFSAALTVRRSYSLTRIRSGMTGSGTGPTWSGLAPLAFTTHGTSTTSSGSRHSMLPRLATLSGMMVLVLK